MLNQIETVTRYYSILLCIFLFADVLAEAQPIIRYNTFSYNVNEGLLQSTIGDMAIDPDNFCWISFPNGIQRFDGYYFKYIDIQAGLPDNKYARFWRCQDGNLLISHAKGISRYRSDSSTFTLVYKQDPALHSSAIFIGEDDNAIFFYDGGGTITALQCGSYAVISAVKIGLPAYDGQVGNPIRFSDNIIEHRVAFCLKKSLYLWDLRKKQILYTGSVLPNSSVQFLRMVSPDRVLYTDYTDYNSLQCWNFATRINEKLPVSGLNNKTHMSRFLALQWQGKYLVSINSRLYETDSSYRVLKSELVNFQNQPVSGNLSVGKIIEDNYGNLYLQTVTGGIRKVIRNNYPIKYYGSLNREENMVIGVFPDKEKNRILVGTSGAGLYVYDTMQRLVRHFRNHSANNQGFSINAIIKNNRGEYLLFPSGEERIWKLSADLSSFTSHPIRFPDSPRFTVNHFGSTIFQNREEAVVQSMYQVFRTNLADNTTTARYLSEEYILSRLWHDNKIIWHENNVLIFMDGQSFKELKRIPLPGTGGVRSMASAPGGNILLGTNNGIFRIDTNGKVLHHWSKENGLPDDCIYALTVDPGRHIWASCNKGIFRINEHHNILQLTREDGLQENEFNTGVVAVAEDGELFFGGMNGVSSFFPGAIGIYDHDIQLLLTRIRVNNADIQSGAASWTIKKLHLSYNQNSLSFDFVAMGNNNPGQYIYQYKMKGVDDEWIQNTGLQTIRYSLAPGKYTFQLFASRSFNKDALPLKEIEIVIQQPFWKRWWFFTGLGILALSLLTYLINQKNKSRYARKLQQLEHEKQLKQERERISKDLHDSLGAYANAVLYNTELLEKEKTEEKRNELVEDLKFASKNIITSLRETVWALKQENYTAEECLVRIRNFIQPLSKYYSYIRFHIEGEAPAGLSLHSVKALNLVMIVQEAISNSIKHAGADMISVNNFTDATEWKIVISDNGKGFDYLSMKKLEKGNGLYNMEQRATESGFGLTLTSNEKKGTEITIII